MKNNSESPFPKIYRKKLWNLAWRSGRAAQKTRAPLLYLDTHLLGASPMKKALHIMWPIYQYSCPNVKCSSRSSSAVGLNVKHISDDLVWGKIYRKPKNFMGKSVEHPVSSPLNQYIDSWNHHAVFGFVSDERYKPALFWRNNSCQTKRCCGYLNFEMYPYT